VVEQVQDDLNLDSSKVVESGLKAVLEIEGTFAKPFKKPSTFGGTQLECTLDDAVIIKLSPGAEMPELKDNKFTQWLKYSAKEGALSPASGTFLAKHFIPDGEKLYAKLTNSPVVPGTLMKLVGQRVRWVLLVETLKLKDKETGATKEVTMKYYTFSTDIMTETDVKEAIKKLVLGKNAKAAKRELMMDSLGKSHPEYKAALDDGTLADKLGIKVVDDVFVE
jgi:hypothetical protein